MGRLPVALIFALVFVIAVVVYIYITPIMPYFSSEGNVTIVVPLGTEYMYWTSASKAKVTLEESQNVITVVYGRLLNVPVVVRKGDVPYIPTEGIYGFYYDVPGGYVKYGETADWRAITAPLAIIDPATGLPAFRQVTFVADRVSAVGDLYVYVPLFNKSAADLVNYISFIGPFEETYAFTGWSYDWTNGKLYVNTIYVKEGTSVTFEVYGVIFGDMAQGNYVQSTVDPQYYTDQDNVKVVHTRPFIFALRVDWPVKLKVELSQ